MSLHRLIIIGIDEDMVPKTQRVTLGLQMDVAGDDIHFFPADVDVKRVVSESFNVESGKVFFGSSSEIMLMDMVPQAQILKFRTLANNVPALSIKEGLQTIGSFEGFNERLISKWLHKEKVTPDEIDKARNDTSGEVDDEDEMVSIERLLGVVEGDQDDEPEEPEFEKTVLGPKTPIGAEISSFVPEEEPEKELFDMDNDRGFTPMSEAEVKTDTSTHDTEESTPAEEAHDDISDIISQFKLTPNDESEDESEDTKVAGEADSENQSAPVFGNDDDESDDSVGDFDLGEPDDSIEKTNEDDLTDVKDEPESVPDEPVAPVMVDEYEDKQEPVHKEPARPREETKSSRSDAPANDETLVAADQSGMFDQDENARQNGETPTSALETKTADGYLRIPTAEDSFDIETRHKQREYLRSQEIYETSRITRERRPTGKKGRIILFTAPKGGVAKSTLAWSAWAGLAQARVKAGNNDAGTWLIETDYNSPKLKYVYSDIRDGHDLGGLARMLMDANEKTHTSITMSDIMEAITNRFSYFDAKWGGRVIVAPIGASDIPEKYFRSAILIATRAISGQGGAIILDGGIFDLRSGTDVEVKLAYDMADHVVLAATPDTAGPVKTLASVLTSSSASVPTHYRPLQKSQIHVVVSQATRDVADTLVNDYFPPINVDTIVPQIIDLLPGHGVFKDGVSHIAFESQDVQTAVIRRVGLLLVACGFTDYEKYFSASGTASKPQSARKTGLLERIVGYFSK